MRRPENPPPGAYGFAQPLDEDAPPAEDDGPTVKGVGGAMEPVLGGWPAAEEARRWVWASANALRAVLADDAREERKAGWWRRKEAEADEAMKSALELTVGARADETDDEYDARLTAVFENLRLRLDAATAPVTVVPDAPATSAPERAHGDGDGAPLVTPPSGPAAVRALAPPAPSPPPPAPAAPAPRPPTVKLTRKQARVLRKAFWARNHRKPTDEEWAAAVRSGVA